MTIDVATNEALWALKDAVVPALAVGLAGIFRMVFPAVKRAIPGPLWPFVATYFARLGTRLCYAIDVPCEGNFVNWSDPEAYALASGVYVLVIHRTAKWLREETPVLLACISDRMYGWSGNKGGQTL